MQCVRFACRDAAAQEFDLLLRIARFGIEVGQDDQDIDLAVLGVLFTQSDRAFQVQFVCGVDVFHCRLTACFATLPKNLHG